MRDKTHTELDVLPNRLYGFSGSDFSVMYLQNAVQVTIF